VLDSTGSGQIAASVAMLRQAVTARA
jgi:hypothetical protein